MDVGDLHKTYKVINEVIGDVNNAKDSNDEAIIALGMLNWVNLFITELAYHRANGEDHDVAILKTLKGELELPASKVTLLNLWMKIADNDLLNDDD